MDRKSKKFVLLFGLLFVTFGEHSSYYVQSKNRDVDCSDGLKFAKYKTEETNKHEIM
jgi:hypothetical protein